MPSTEEKQNLSIAPVEDDAAAEQEEYQKLLALYDDSMRNLTEGEIVTGRVIGVTSNAVIVDVGCRNTVFNAVPQSAAEFLPRMVGMGLRWFRLELLRETAAEVGPHQIVLPMVRGAGERQHGQAERRQNGGQARGVERLVHGIAGAGMGEAQVEQRSGGERRAAAGQPDARRGEFAQLRPGIAWRCWRRESRHGSRHGSLGRATLAGHSRHAGSSARKLPGRLAGRMRSFASISPWRANQASNSGAGRRWRRSRMASAS